MLSTTTVCIQTTPGFAVPLPSIWPMLIAATQAGEVYSTGARKAVHAARPLFNTDIDDAPNLGTVVTIETIDHLLTINSLPDHSNHSP